MNGHDLTGTPPDITREIIAARANRLGIGLRWIYDTGHKMMAAEFQSTADLREFSLYCNKTDLQHGQGSLSNPIKKHRRYIPVSHLPHIAASLQRKIIVEASHHVPRWLVPAWLETVAVAILCALAGALTIEAWRSGPSSTGTYAAAGLLLIAASALSMYADRAEEGRRYGRWLAQETDPTT